jgi:hypothetical protein
MISQLPIATVASYPLFDFAEVLDIQTGTSLHYTWVVKIVVGEATDSD